MKYKKGLLLDPQKKNSQSSISRAVLAYWYSIVALGICFFEIFSKFQLYIDDDDRSQSLLGVITYFTTPNKKNSNFFH